MGLPNEFGLPSATANSTRSPAEPVVTVPADAGLVVPGRTVAPSSTTGVARPLHSPTHIVGGDAEPGSEIVTAAPEPSVTPNHTSMFKKWVDSAARVHVAPPPVTDWSAFDGMPPTITSTSPERGGIGRTAVSVSALWPCAVTCWTSTTSGCNGGASGAASVNPAASPGPSSTGVASVTASGTGGLAVSSHVTVAGEHTRPVGHGAVAHGLPASGCGAKHAPSATPLATAIAPHPIPARRRDPGPPPPRRPAPSRDSRTRIRSS